VSDSILKDAFLKLVKEAMDQNVSLLDNTITIRVTDHQIDWISTVDENYNPQSPCYKISLEEIKKRNRHFMEHLHSLVKRFRHFELNIYVDESGHIILNEHSFITGRWYFQNEKEFWTEMTCIQEGMPELFKQANSELTFFTKMVGKEMQISYLEYKFYFFEAGPFCYNPVKKYIMKENEVTLATILNEVSTSQMPCIIRLKKDKFGKLVTFHTKRKFMKKNTDFRR
jgi:hypothetical protein